MLDRIRTGGSLSHPRALEALISTLFWINVPVFQPVGSDVCAGTCVMIWERAASLD